MLYTCMYISYRYVRIGRGPLLELLRHPLEAARGPGVRTTQTSHKSGSICYLCVYCHYDYCYDYDDDDYSYYHY